MSTNSISTAPTSENVIRQGNVIIYTNACGEYHRLDGPAVEWSDGTKEWYQNGHLHRLDGPAYEGANGEREWRIEGKLHRLDGPAIEYSDGSKQWWIDGKYYRTEEEWLYARCPSIETLKEMFKEVQS